MTTNQSNAQNQATNQNEAVESEKAKKQAASSVTRAMRVFVEERLSSADGQAFFNRIVQDNGYGEEELRRMFMESVDRQEALDERDDHLKEALANVTMRQIRNTAIGLGAGFESKRSALRHIVEARYEFDAAKRGAIDEYIEKNLSMSALTDCVRSEAKRMRMLQKALPGMNRKEIESNRREHTNELEKVFAGKHLSDEQRAAALNLLNRENVRPEDLRSIMGLFTELEEKQLLVKLFIPQVSLDDLETAGVLTHSQVRESIRKSISH